MKTTIDKAGRLVIPAEIRRKARLSPGVELDVLLDDNGIRLVRNVERPRVERKGGRPLIVLPSTVKPLSTEEVSNLVRDERDRQAGKQE